MAILSRIAANAGDDVAVLAGRKAISYNEFLSDIERTAAYFSAQGLGPGSLVGVGRGEGDHYRLWIALLAAIKVGATHASISDARSITDLLSARQVDAIIGRFSRDSAPSDVRLLEVNLDSLSATACSSDNELEASRLNFTSGSTGAPKITHWDSEMMAARVMQIVNLGLIGSGTRLVSLLPARTTAGFRYPIACWWCGGTVLLPHGPENELAQLGTSTLCVCSPLQLQQLMGDGRRWQNRSLRTLVVLGGRLPQAVRDWALQNIASTILIAYGSTETGNIAFGDAALVDQHPGAVGLIRPGVEVEIVDDVGRPVKLGHPGRLRVRTPLLASPSSTEGWFEPGDNAILFEDGLLAILERAFDVLNVGGVKASAVDLEAKLAAFEAIEDAAVTMISSVNGDLLAVVIVPATGLTPTQLMPMVKPVVPVGVPFSLMITRSIPRNDMGKIDRHALRQSAQRAERAQTQHERRHA